MSAIVDKRVAAVEDAKKIAKNDMAGYLAENLMRVAPVFSGRLDFGKFAVSCVVAANQLSKPCEPSSVLIAAFNAAHLGMAPGGSLGLCYFVPRFDKGKNRCCLDIGYRGFLELAYETGFLRDVTCEVRYDGEPFEVWVEESGRKLKHYPDMDRDLSSAVCRQKMTHVYCTYSTVSGGYGSRVLNRKQIDRIDTAAFVWAAEYYEMCCKSAIRRAAKYWRLTSRFADAVLLDEQSERGESRVLDSLRGLESLSGIISQQKTALEFEMFGSDDSSQREGDSPVVEVR